MPIPIDDNNLHNYNPSTDLGKEVLVALQQRQAVIVWDGNLDTGSGRVRVGSGALPEFPVTFAARTESPGGKTSPEELIAAAHATCYTMVLANKLAQAGSPPKGLTVTATCSLDRLPEGGLKITRMDLDVRSRTPGMSADQFKALALESDKACPVSNALRNNVEIQVNAQLEA